MIESDVQTLEPGPYVELWELNATSIGGGVLRFQGQQDGQVVWQGQTYEPWTCQGEGFERTSEQQPTPRFRVGNPRSPETGKYVITALCQAFDDLVGARLIRRRTFAKYLDAVNFPASRNVLRNSANGMGPAWTVENVVKSAYGTVVADGISFDATLIQNIEGSTVTSRLNQLHTFAYETGQRYIITIYLKLGTGSFRHVIRNSSTNRQITVTGSSGNATADFTAPLGVSKRISYTDLGNGVRKLVLSFEPTGSYANMQYSLGASQSNALGNVIFLGMQVERDNATAFQVTGNAVSGNPTADPTKEFPPEMWFIERKSAESAEGVEFELSSALDFNGVRLPRRQIIANQCPFRYRGPLCNYTGPAVADELDVPTSDPALDKCGKRLQSCRMRLWPDNILNFGGQPAAGLVRT